MRVEEKMGRVERYYTIVSSRVGVEVVCVWRGKGVRGEGRRMARLYDQLC